MCNIYLYDNIKGEYLKVEFEFFNTSPTLIY